MSNRLSTGIPALDEMLGGGLLGGTLTVLMGATGIGKTQLGLQFAQAGQADEGRPGILFDMSCRGDAQGHAEYAQRLGNWRLTPLDANGHPPREQVFDLKRPIGDYLHVFDCVGRRVTRNELRPEDWQDWQAELGQKLDWTIAFIYGNLLRGSRRVVVDGIEPVDRAADSIQLELFEYIYHQILRKDPEWVARDLLRERYREHAAQAAAVRYDPRNVACVLLATSREAMLHELIDRPLEAGDQLANANTLIYLGRVRSAGRIQRALHIAKHRGSRCSDEVREFDIDDRGIFLA